MKTLPPLILASASSRRADLLRQMDLDFEAVPAEVTEVVGDHLTPREICQVNAFHKARAVARQHPNKLVLGADTVVCLQAQIFGKPASLSQAAEMLSMLQGRAHEEAQSFC